jgi:hypothetical protein
MPLDELIFYARKLSILYAVELGVFYVFFFALHNRKDYATVVIVSILSLFAFLNFVALRILISNMSRINLTRATVLSSCQVTLLVFLLGVSAVRGGWGVFAICFGICIQFCSVVILYGFHKKIDENLMNLDMANVILNNEVNDILYAQNERDHEQVCEHIVTTTDIESNKNSNLQCNVIVNFCK